MTDSLDNYFVFAGKIYRRAEPVTIENVLRRQSRFLSGLILLIPLSSLVVLWAARLVLSGGSLSQSVVSLGGARRRRKVIYETGASLADEIVVIPTYRNVRVKPVSILEELDDIRSALKAIVKPAGSQSVMPDIELESFRVELTKIRDNDEFLRVFRTLIRRLGNSMTVKSHPLRWTAVQTTLDSTLAHAATSIGIDSAAVASQRCGRCGEPATPGAEMLSARRRHALKDLVCRVSLNSIQEQVLLFAIKSKERPEEIFVEQDCLRIIEPLNPSWSTIGGVDFQSKVAFGSNFLRIQISPFVKFVPTDSLLRAIESCVRSRGVKHTTVTCGILDSSSTSRRIYAFKNGYDVCNFDVIVDQKQGYAYINTTTCDAVMRKSVLSVILQNDSLQPSQGDVVAHARSREATVRTLLILEDEFSEIHAFSASAKVAHVPERTDLGKIAEAFKKQLKLPIVSSVGICWYSSLVDSRKDDKRSLVSPKKDQIVFCISQKELENETVTVMAFVRDRAFCSCQVKKAFEAVFHV